VSVDFTGVVGEPSPACRQNAKDPRLAAALAVEGDVVRGRFEYETTAVVSRTIRGARIYDLDPKKFDIRLSLSRRDAFRGDEYLVVVHDSLAFGERGERVAGFQLDRAPGSDWPGNPDFVNYGIILRGFDVPAWPSLPNGFDGERSIGPPGPCTRTGRAGT
jgi:hypothetical protein